MAEKKSRPGGALPAETLVSVEMERRGMSIAQLARSAGLAQPFVWRIIKKRVPISKETAEKIGHVLDMDPADVMWPNGRP